MLIIVALIVFKKGAATVGSSAAVGMTGKSTLKVESINISEMNFDSSNIVTKSARRY